MLVAHQTTATRPPTRPPTRHLTPRLGTQRCDPTRSDLPHRARRTRQHRLLCRVELPVWVARQRGKQPSGVGHVRCLLHITAAKALWALGRQQDARRAAADALTAAPTDEQRADVHAEVGEMVESRDQARALARPASPRTLRIHDSAWSRVAWQLRQRDRWRGRELMSQGCVINARPLGPRLSSPQDRDTRTRACPCAWQVRPAL